MEDLKKLTMNQNGIVKFISSVIVQVKVELLKIEVQSTTLSQQCWSPVNKKEKEVEPTY